MVINNKDQIFDTYRQHFKLLRSESSDAESRLTEICNAEYRLEHRVKINAISYGNKQLILSPASQINDPDFPELADEVAENEIVRHYKNGFEIAVGVNENYSGITYQLFVESRDCLVDFEAYAVLPCKVGTTKL